MKRAMTKLSLILAATLASGFAHGAITGNQLLDELRKKSTYSLAYVTGVVDASSLLITVSRQHAKNIKTPDAAPDDFCVPNQGATYSQFAEIVTLWLEANPALRQQSAALSVLVALKEAFPCK